MENKSRLPFVIIMYWVFRIGFWLHLTLVLSLILFNYFSYNSKQGINFKIGGYMRAYDETGNRTQGEILDSISSKPTFFLTNWKSGFVWINYTDISKAATIKNTIYTISNILPWLLCLFITYQLMKILQSLKSEDVFNIRNIKRVKFIGWVIILIPFFQCIRDRLFLVIINEHIKVPGYIILKNTQSDLVPFFTYEIQGNLFPKVCLGLIILIIAEIFKYGFGLQKEKDLTI